MYALTPALLRVECGLIGASRLRLMAEALRGRVSEE
jgi:hypothetical protein